MRLDSLINVITDYARLLGAIAGYGYRQQESEFFEAHGDEGVAVFVSPDVTLPAYPGYYGYRIAAEGADGGQMLDRLRFLLRTDCDIRYDRNITYGGGVWAYAVSLRLKAKKYGLGGGGLPVPDALNFTMQNGGTITLTRNGNPTTVTLEYTLDGGRTWTEWVESGTTRTLTLQAGETVYIRNTSDTSTGLSTGISDYYRFSFSDTAHAYGNTNSLLCKDPNNAIILDYCFLSLFNGASTLKSAAEIPSLVTADRCYQDMYKGTGISVAPVLPATYVDIYAYYRIFADCPDLAYVKTYMTSLYSLSSINYWLRDVAATGDFYCDPSLNIPLNSGSGIPSGWTRHDL